MRGGRCPACSIATQQRTQPAEALHHSAVKGSNRDTFAPFCAMRPPTTLHRTPPHHPCPASLTRERRLVLSASIHERPASGAGDLFERCDHRARVSVSVSVGPFLSTHAYSSASSKYVRLMHAITSVNAVAGRRAGHRYFSFCLPSSQREQPFMHVANELPKQVIVTPFLSFLPDTTLMQASKQASKPSALRAAAMHASSRE